MGSSSGGGSQTTTSTNTANTEPWGAQQPFLKAGFNAALENFNNPPDFYGGNTYVPFSPQTNMSMNMTQGRALQGSPVNFANMQHATDVMQGSYLNSNPYIDQAYDYSADALTRNYNNVINPAIDSGFAGAGRYGSGLWASMRGDSNDTLARNLGGMASNMYGQNYANERNNMMSMASLAPQIANQDYFDINQLAGVGQATESKAGEVLRDSMNRFNFYQNRPENQLRNYAALIGGNYGGTTNKTSTTTQPTSGSGFFDILGGGLQIANLVAGNPVGFNAGFGFNSANQLAGMRF